MGCCLYGAHTELIIKDRRQRFALSAIGDGVLQSPAQTARLARSVAHNTVFWSCDSGPPPAASCLSGDCGHALVLIGEGIERREGNRDTEVCALTNSSKINHGEGDPEAALAEGRPERARDHRGRRLDANGE